MLNWEGAPFPQDRAERTLHSDASGIGWGGLDVTAGGQLQEFCREHGALHINVKELHAAIETIRSFARPNERVHLSVDNTVAYAYIKKSGGRRPQFNAFLRPFLKWCKQNNIIISVNLVTSENMLADKLSRTPFDQGDYRLDRHVSKPS